MDLLLILALCAFIVLSLTSGMRKNAKVLTYAEVNPLDGTIVGEMAKAFKEKTEELSGGRLLIDIQAGGVLGSEDQILDNLLGGGNICDITRISAFALTQYGCEKASQFFISDIPDIRDYMVEMNTLPAMVYGVGVFTLISACCGERETKSRTAAMLSQQSFGIYITHVFVLDILIGVLLPYTVFQEQHPLLYTLVVFIPAFGLSLLLTLGLSKIKGVKKLVRE